jgi:hypothetical protein
VSCKLPTVRTYIERVTLDQSFAGRHDNTLDRFKAMIDDGWDLVVLIEYRPSTRRGERPKPTGDVIALGCREADDE